ncbi:phosphatidylserine/phosphatidylglycerophosphate/cardiolipin synthase family protein [Erythrobacter sp. JK5]|uniref:phospholipase D-like domain-containing protein n=1 Tax=Erythrobacter sp. JK5 TaxID=2829500 RepID=UPI001BAC5647|nr:phosphatidylserine/phosphatidylglycerophosphate/cardiolipin synthase family protein [Erythrobacter sp. JK5]QUL37691.1 phosphatidylserine/phosphatidylglycerophosphate/cardiolipin synthase family protein [Erythrobacter sp. JK5]
MIDDPLNPELETGDAERWESDPNETFEGYRDADPFEVETQDHRFVFYPAGIDRLAALESHIQDATETLHVFFYLFQPDEAGELVRDALVAAAERGVAVHLVVDDFGSDAPQSFFDPLVEAGAKFDLFSPRWNVRYLIRNHQKFVVADRKRLMTGGFNVSDHYFKPPEENGWCDLGALIEGPVVARFEEWFGQLDQWLSSGGSQFRAMRAMVRDWDPGDGPVQLVLGGPTKMTSAWALRVKEDLAQGERLDMVMAYFSPPRSVQQLIERLSRKGAARLIMAGKTDNGATIGASRALYRRLLRAGAKIAEFQPSKLHMKLLVIDDVTYFGSANMDMRSVRLNLELMLRVEDAGLAARMRELVDHLEDYSTPITDSWFRQRASWFNRARWRLSYWLVAVFDYSVARRLNLGQ